MKIKISSKICRICLNTMNYGTSLIDDVVLSEKFEYLTNSIITAKHNKELPTKICCKCIVRLNAAYELKNQCFESEKYLRDYILAANRRLDMQIQQARSQLTKTDTTTSIQIPIVKYEKEVSSQEEDVDYATSIKESGDYNDSSSFNRAKNDDLDLDSSVDEHLIIDDNIEPDDDNKEITIEENISENAAEEFIDMTADNESNNGSIASSYMDIDYLDEYHDVIVQHTNIYSPVAHNESGFTNKATLKFTAEYNKPIDNKYLCYVCNSNFNSESSLMQHKFEQHNVNDKFICDICDEKFIQLSALRKHITIKHVKKSFKVESTIKCTNCQRNFYNLRAFKKHYPYCNKFNEYSMFYKCSDCDVLFNSKYQLDKHLETNCKTNIQMVVSSSPSLSAKSAKELTNMNKNKTLCIDCNENFSTSELLINHQRIVHADKLYYKCDYCDRDFRRQSWFNLHQKQHSRDMIKKINPVWNQGERKYLNCAKQIVEIAADVPLETNVDVLETNVDEQQIDVDVPQADVEVDINEKNDLILILED